MPMDCVPVDALLIPVAKTNIFGNGRMITAPIIFKKGGRFMWLNSWAFLVQYFGKLHLYVLNKFL